ncbi:MAG: DNA polymerase III subunit delta' [Planctomycetes bacterium]|nr:DNA polymerase III subunit delta' [Planctomycetota bacterium]
MTWQGIEGHDAIVDRFRRGLAGGRLPSTFLFVGPAGVGKRAFAIKLAQTLLCEVNPPELIDPCGECPGCKQVLAGSHPDLAIVGREEDSAVLKVEQFIGDREHRMQEGLVPWVSLKPTRGTRKIAIVDDADLFNQESANCLLKTLEEPPPGSMLILIGTSEQRQLPTIRSRCQIVRFRPLPDETVARLLLETGAVADSFEAERLAALSGGGLRQAIALADPELMEFRRHLLSHLGRPGWNSVALGKSIHAFVEAAGKEAPPRRERLRSIIGFCADFYRQLMARLSGAVPAGDPQLREAVEGAASAWPGDAALAADRLERCLDALAHVDANAHLVTVTEAWIDDLAHG